MKINYQTLILKKNGILEEIKNVKYNDLENLVYRMQLTYDEGLNILGIKDIPTKRTGFSLNPDNYEVIHLNNTLKNILPDNVKLSVTKDDARKKSNLKVYEKLYSTEKSFFLHF